MTILQSIILGLVQGLTEFLPVSSSGHLVIMQKVLGMPSNIPFDVALHLATLLAVLTYFAKDIWNLLKAFFTWKRESEHFKIAWLIILGSVPTAIIGFAFEDIFAAMFDSVLAVGCFLILTGILIMFAERIGSGQRKADKINWLDAVIIGVAQGCAVAPGLSRSGTTISASLARNLDRTLAARFSFLLSIPALLGAGIFKAKELAEISLAGNQLIPVVFGILAAFISGYIAIKLFMQMIQKQSIRIFAYYAFLVGISAIIASFL